MDELTDPTYEMILKKIKESPSFRKFADELAIQMISEGELTTIYKKEYIDMIAEKIFDEIEASKFNYGTWASIYGCEKGKIN